MRMAATAAVYNRLHNTSVGVVGGGGSNSVSGGSSGTATGGHHHQLARSLERILEEAHLSGELILTNRKLKDFPKTGTKFNLSDTVIADLSRNRFCELPEEITTFSFLETLLLYHNTIRSIPESVKHLTSLTYLDLRSNQLSSLPRELCFLPLQVLLVSNNRLTALPDELGRMDRLTDLDASYNQLTTLPARIGELRSLRSFSLRSNQLMYLPRELTCLTLVSLDVSNNRISSLPLEIRQMSTLVEINLENNPMTSPPASLCVRGLVHVFKYLETQATKDEKGSRAGGNYDGYTTLRRAPRNQAGGNVVDTHRHGRHHVDSGYSTCDGIDKRWSHDMPIKSKADSPKVLTPTTPPLAKATLVTPDLMDSSLTSSTSTIVDESLSVSAAVVKPLNMESQSTENLASSPLKTNKDENRMTNNVSPQLHNNYHSHNISGSSNGSTPDLDDGMIDHHELQQQQLSQTNSKQDDKFNKNLGNVQTYREYKEALKQQRSQEVYKIKEQKHINDSNEQHHLQSNNSAVVPPNNQAPANDDMEIRLNGNTQTAPVPKSIMKNSANNTNGLTNASVATTNGDDIVVIPKKPIQKVIPSRNTELMSATVKNELSATNNTNGDCIGYVKPSSPMKMVNGTSNGSINTATVSGVGVGILTNNNKFTTTTAGSGISNSSSNNKLVATGKPHRTVTWNHDIPPEKLSFTMRREFDRQREEIELMTQLRSIIETRLKMTLPEDIASALTDGVILCHLANYVRPRSVASIHVPSPGVSKLTMARCRRNVDNFLEACRKIGVDEELICSCADVVPLYDNGVDDEDAVDGGDNSTQQCGDSNVRKNDFQENNNQNDLNFSINDQQRQTVVQPQRKELPNITAVLKTVAALIALDMNPHHQNVTNLQQQHDFQMKLQQYEKKQLKLKLDKEDKRRCVLLEEVEREQEEEKEMKVLQQMKGKQSQPEEQKQFTATCTKEQMMREFEKSNFEQFSRYDSNRNVDDGDDHKHRDYIVYHDDEKQQQQQLRQPKVHTSLGNFYRHCKLKTFQKIKLNLITHHGNTSDNFGGSSELNTTTTLQTIVETDNDVISGIGGGYTGSSTNTSGLYQIVDEKYNNELSLKVISSLNEMSGSQTPNKYQLLELPSTEKNNAEKPSLTTATSVSKRIEFFEHANIPNGGIIKPKSNIYSIYRVNEAAVESEKKLLTKEVLLKEKEAGSSIFMLRHDSHTLTIILSCVFIVTFLFLNLICCAADVLEGKGAVQVAITVCELFRLHSGNIQNSKSPTRANRAALTPSPIV
ncbi:leucine-rich repeat and calponin homology domain-containing protein [Musca vetustissima]|uniref:leucine-rich repeat and calponin homology domain-containing protein n=1 Tax=Musca vetustissima TaxID=27455 RepID=UPI002AB7C32E|nr:leucine-rich repeat and calponin homology domain-containing protein [Musca vetustissima]